MEQHKFLLQSLIIFVLASFYLGGYAQVQESPLLKIKISVAPAIKGSFQKEGRLFLRLNRQRGSEPRTNAEITIAITPQNWDGTKPFVFDTKNKNILTSGFDKLSCSKPEKFYCQMFYKQDLFDCNENAAANLYSKVDSFILAKEVNINLTLTTYIQPVEVTKHELVKTVTIQSKYLTEFFGKPRFLTASILLPASFHQNHEKSYPICYRAPGLGGRLTRINDILKDKDFMGWWFSKDAPQVVYVFLDSRGPYGDTYQVDSENNGP